MKRHLWLGVLALCASAATAAEPPSLERQFRRLRGTMYGKDKPEGMIGVTRKGTPIGSVLAPNAWDMGTARKRILLVGGLRGDDGSTAAVIDALGRFYRDPAAAPYGERFSLSVIPCGNPDGVAAGLLDSNGSGGNPAVGYPPKKDFYNSPTDPEAAYLWRWIGTFAPDWVIVVSRDPPARPDGTLLEMARSAPAGVGTIPAVAVSDVKDLAALLDRAPEEISPARREMQRRLERSPETIARELAIPYGHKLPTMIYTSALAVAGRLRFAVQQNDAEMLADVQRVVEPFLGEKPALGPKSGPSDVAGHVLFYWLARATGDQRYAAPVIAAAGRGFDAGGQPLSSMPSHNEMSDAVFMNCPVLAQAGALTGDKKYYDMCVRHLRFMQKLCLRPDGIYRHSPLDEAAWGRGNGFSALGLALVLSEFPEDHPDRAAVLRSFQSHLRALLPHQDANGCWHQVIDHPESYSEFTSTAMITLAMARGVQYGWLEQAEFAEPIDRAWRALRMRIGSDGQLIDVCTGTGKQRSLRDYYDRPAIVGLDDRGGSMALMVTTEMIAYEKWRAGDK